MGIQARIARHLPMAEERDYIDLLINSFAVIDPRSTWVAGQVAQSVFMLSRAHHADVVRVRECHEYFRMAPRAVFNFHVHSIAIWHEENDE